MMWTETTEQYYRIPDWGAGYVRVTDAGLVALHPEKLDGQWVALAPLAAALRKQGIRPPVRLHFPQALGYAVRKLAGSFQRAIAEFSYNGGYAPVYPIKANPSAHVVRALLEAGTDAGLGLEAGSIPELAAVLSVAGPNTRVVCNGYKDRRMLALAMSGTARAGEVVIVIEKFSELPILLHALGNRPPDPKLRLGVRVRLHTRGTGRWEESGGDFAKFGLTAAEILAACRMLKQAGCLDRLQMIHVHIGSQITHTTKVKAMVQEAGMLYAELVRAGVPIRMIDFGGGLGVDYTGSRSAEASSVNYTVTEYANNVVFHLKEVCERKQVPDPDILTESGRALTAYHEVLVVETVEQHSLFSAMPVLDYDFSKEKLLFDLKDTYDRMTTRNLWEYFHDAVHMKEQLHTRFNVGDLSLREKAVGEQIFWNVVRKAMALAKRADAHSEELDRLASLLASKYVTNMSIFRSIPDVWAIGQLLPVVPLQRLLEPPGEHAILADITCDSDGKVNRFVDVGSVRPMLRLHRLKGEPYLLGVFLTGAYQDAMGNAHNLFGRTAAVSVTVTGPDRFETEVITAGDPVSAVLVRNGYEPGAVAELPGIDGEALLADTTYLDREPMAAVPRELNPVTKRYRCRDLDCPRCTRELQRLLADLPMVLDARIMEGELAVTVSGADMIGELERALASEGFEVKEDERDVDR